MMNDRKKKAYEKYLLDFNLQPSLEIANAFYYAYGEGYADSAEDGMRKNNNRITIDDFENYGKERGY